MVVQGTNVWVPCMQLVPFSNGTKRRWPVALRHTESTYGNVMNGFASTHKAKLPIDPIKEPNNRSNRNNKSAKR